MNATALPGPPRTTERKVLPIHNGTVIDHIPGGLGVKVLNLLGLDSHSVRSALSLLMQVPSDKLGMKDMLKVEDRELAKEEVNLIALIAPQATICIIREGRVEQKFSVTLPDQVVGAFSCPNSGCITNSLTKQGRREPVAPEFIREQADPVLLTCAYCSRPLTADMIRDLLEG